MTVRGYTLAFDWTRAGTFGNAYEDATTSGRVQDGDIEVSWGRSIEPGGEVTLKAASGQMTLALNNRDKLFSPEYTAGPLYNKILPNVAVQFLKLAPSGSLYTLLKGVMDTFTVTADTPRTFSATVLDAWGRPGGEQLSTPLYQSIRTGTAIGLVLDAIGWTGPRALDAGASVLPWWWEEGTDAATAIDKIVASEGAPAIAYVEGGTFVFRDRHHRLTNTRSTTSQGLFTHIEPAGTGPVGDFKMERGTWLYDHGVRNIVNSAIFAVDIRVAKALAEVWSSDDTLTLASGDNLVMTVQPDDPFLNAQLPVVGQDILISSGSIGSISLSRTSGQTTVLSFTATSATVITRMALRAVAASVTRTIQVSAKDASSAGTFGTQSWPDSDNPVWAGQYDAQVIANRIVALYATYRPVITFTIYAINDTYLNKLMDLKVSDRITVRHDPNGVNSGFMIEKIAHKVTNLSQHRVTLTCVATEPTQPSNVIQFDLAGHGFDQGFFGVNGIDNGATMFRFDTAGVGFDQGVFAN